jgi:hypothetical protein
MIRSIRPLRLLAGIPLIAALSGVAVAAAPAAAQASCEAKIMSTGHIWGDGLQFAVDEAPAGDTIQIRGGCLGPIIINKRLTLVGKASTILGAPGIYGQESVRVLEIAAGKTVTVKNLEIAYGYVGSTAPVGGDDTTAEGGGILNRGTLTLTNVVVTENDAEDGGGIANYGTLLINGASQVHHNRASRDGAGILSEGTVTLAGATAVHTNTALNFGGGVAAVRGTAPAPGLTLRDSAVIRDNTAGSGGGIAVGRVPVVLRDTASVRANTASDRAGGILLLGAGLTMQGRASISGNTGDFVGGIAAEPDGGKVARVTMKGSSVLKRNVGQIAGIYLQGGSLTMVDGSSIRGHRTLPSSAAVAVGVEEDLVATFTMKGRSLVTDNRVSAGWAAVLKLRCPGDPTPTFIGVKARTTGNTPKNLMTACP